MRRLLTALLVLVLLGALIAALVVQRNELPPRRLAAYLDRRAEGHGSILFDVVRSVARTLEALDRGSPPLPLRPSLRIGAQPPASAASGVEPPPRLLIGTEAQLLIALQQAQPGEVLTLLPGRYRFGDKAVAVDRPGRLDAPITMRAQQPGSVLIELDTVEGFRVTAPHWHFENLTLRGVCAQHARCEHAFHVIDGAIGFVARNLVVTDFNAHFKINGSAKGNPDRGLIESSTLSNGSARDTDTPVTPIDIVAASGWVVRHNLIADFVIARPFSTSYGAFAKGGGKGNRFERNIVLCEHAVRRQPGSRVGLSLGGGGTGSGFCREGTCITEQDSSLVEGNLVAFCSDAGIDVNRAAMSKVRHNTLVDTAGISVRGAAASAEVEGNLVDGSLYGREGGALHSIDNLDTALLRLYVGNHPVRSRFADVPALDFTWRGEVPRRAAADSGAPRDLCGTPRPPQPAYGAFEDFRACLTTPR
jgi:hypothetical protein